MRTITYDETKWKLVPIEPLRASAEAIALEVQRGTGQYTTIDAAMHIYRAGIDRAPQPPEVESLTKGTNT